MNSSIAIASFNIHGGVDGWGRPFDVIGACRELDADVLILQENLVTEDGSSIASTVAETLGYVAIEVPFTAVELSHVFAPSHDERRWGPPGFKPPMRAIRYPDAGSPPWRRTTTAERAVGSQSVTFGLAVLARVAHTSTVVQLPHLVAEPARRALIVLDVPVGGGSMSVAGTHFGHLTHGSPFQMLAAGRALRDGPPTVLGGDMNCWGPIVLQFLPAFHRAVLGPTWPSWRPRHQIDHLLGTRGVAFEHPRVFPSLGSDHLAIRVEVALGSS